ncbi:unnamed protein product, partial [Trichobilharzia szidati]
ICIGLGGNLKFSEGRTTAPVVNPLCHKHSSAFPVNSYRQNKYFGKLCSVKLIQRRKTEVDYGSEATEIENRFTQVVIDFDRLDDYKEVFQGTDIGFCALGTTLKKSGKEKMRVIDHDYVIRIAELSSAAGCKEFHLVTSK